MKNTAVMGILYIERNNNFSHDFFILRSTSFIDNKGTPVYLSNQKLYMEGKNVFIKNQAEDCSGIYVSDHASVTFSNHSINVFNHNKAMNSGGAIYLTNHASVSFEGNSTVDFTNNNVLKNGGSISSNVNSTIIFKGNTNVYFNDNTAEYGGALYSEHDCDILFDQKCMVTFSPSSTWQSGEQADLKKEQWE